MAPRPAMQAGYYMQQPQAAGMAQQQHQGIFPSKTPLQSGSLHQMPDHQQRQQQMHPQTMQGQMEMSPSGIINSMHPMHKKQDASEPSSTTAIDGESS